jgi:GWxTD domain-containing protein
MILDHLWQSTLFSLAAILLVQAFRKNRAQIRYGIWLAASVKFLVPFALIAAAGSYAGLRSSPAVRGPLFLIEQAAEPFKHAWPARPPLDASGLSWVAIAALAALWACGVAAVGVRWFCSWRHARRILRTSAPATRGPVFAAFGRLNAGDIPLCTTRNRIDPGVFGIFRPVVLLPEHIARGLDADELEAVLAHELAHARRRDNLIAALQHLIQALFWFHPLVWWIGMRLVEERERICDAAALTRVREPQIYARAILRVCEISAESRLPCVAGIGRTSLRKRIEDIMMNRTGLNMGIVRKCLLAAAAIAAVTAPLVTGIAATARRVELPPVAVPPLAAAPVVTAPARPPHPASGARLATPRQTSNALRRWPEEDVVYIITPEEREAFRALQADEERAAFIDQFWARRDPTPGTAENEFKDEHFRRIAAANRQFVFGDVPGWRTDRGKVFIQWGPPDEMESHPEGGLYMRLGAGAQTFNFPYEIWLYRYIEGTGVNVIVEFLDPSRTGNFVKAEKR